MTEAELNNEEIEEIQENEEEVEVTIPEEEEKEKETVSLEEYNKLIERLEKAEKRIVEQKKQVKSTVKSSGEDVVTKKDLEIMRFIDKNSEFDGYEEDLKGYIDKGLSLDDAAVLLKNKDEVLKNKATSKQINVTGGEAGGTKTIYTKDELSKLPQNKYNEVMDLKERGKVKIVN